MSDGTALQGYAPTWLYDVRWDGASSICTHLVVRQRIVRAVLYVGNSRIAKHLNYVFGVANLTIRQSDLHKRAFKHTESIPAGLLGVQAAGAPGN